MNARKLWVLALGSAWVVQAQAQADKPGAAAPNDAQIAQIVVVANQADVNAAKLAETRASDPAVKDFASTMIRDHEAVNKQAKDLVQKLKVKPQPSAVSRSLAKGDKENLASLKKLKGSAFDQAYIRHEVAYHQQVIDALNSTLVPNAKNPQLKALLEKAVPVFEEHLQHAKQLESQVASGGSAATSGTGSTTGGGTGRPTK